MESTRLVWHARTRLDKVQLQVCAVLCENASECSSPGTLVRRVVVHVRIERRAGRGRMNQGAAGQVRENEPLNTVSEGLHTNTHSHTHTVSESSGRASLRPWWRCVVRIRSVGQHTERRHRKQEVGFRATAPCDLIRAQAMPAACLGEVDHQRPRAVAWGCPGCRQGATCCRTDGSCSQHKAAQQQPGP